MMVCTLTELGLALVLSMLMAAGVSSSPPSSCELDLCACTSGEPMCARNRTGLYIQLPDCFQHCFKSCCRPDEAPYDIHPGRCMVPEFAEVIVEPFNGTVGLVEVCSGIYLAAIDATCPK